MKFDRASGILLHPSSLPGHWGVGGIGSAAYRWIDFLANAGCSLWQVLPLGPTGYGDSPYQAFSAFAGNPYLISIENLLEEGLLRPADVEDRPDFPSGRVDYGMMIPWKLAVLDRAYAACEQLEPAGLKAELEFFQEEQRDWLEDFALFMALKDAHGGRPWPNWDAGLRDRKPAALKAAREKHAGAVRRQIFRQFIFFRQWAALKAYAVEHGIKIIGDVPIFVAHDSADVWAHPELFYLDNKGNPTSVAGVPPDYFSPTGQLWGNPLYRWEIHQQTGYQWWQDRLKAVLQTVDIIRLDHFRGFSGYWEVPAGMPTAEKGRWAPGPGADFFEKIRAALGDLPLIAEDLGEITDDVVELREQFELPGMKIVQFAFGGDPDEKFLPHNYPRNCVAYTGTHDNDTTLGWYRSAPEAERDFCRRYLGRGEGDIVWGMIRAVWSSVAMFAIAPIQDFLVQNTEARMNFPGKPGGNWSYRLPAQVLENGLVEAVKDFNFLYGRLPENLEAKERTG